MTSQAEILRKIAQEDNPLFSQYSKRVMIWLPKGLKVIAKDITTAIDTLPELTTKPERITYIPTFHTGNHSENNHLAAAVENILKKISDDSTLIVSGETKAESLNKPNILTHRNATLKRLVDLGLMESFAYRRALTSENLFDLEGVVRYLNQHPRRSVGTDNTDREILFTALEYNPKLKLQGRNEEIGYRFGIEAGTRIALTHGCLNLQGEKHLVFMQGLLHLFGVVSLCDRNNIPLEIEIPPSLEKAADKLLS